MSRHHLMSPVVVLAAASLLVTPPAAAQDTPPAEPAPAAAPAPPTPPAPPQSDAVAVEGAAEPLQRSKDAFKKGAWQEALDAALEALAVQPKLWEALYIAGASERQVNRLTDAEGHLLTLVEASPNFPLASFQLGYVQFLLADGLAHTGSWDEAKVKYREAADAFGRELARNPNHIASMSSRAVALGRAGSTDESVQAHEVWIAAVPQKNDPVVSLAATLAAAGRSTEAMAALDRIPDQSPAASFDAVLATANVFLARKDFGAAIPFLEKACSVDPASSRARALLTASYARALQLDDAVPSLKTFLTLEPTPEEAEAVGEAMKTAFGDGIVSPSRDGVEPPAVLKVPAPKYPTGRDQSIQTEVLVLTAIQPGGLVGETVVVPNRIWKDLRDTGFEEAAFAAVRRGKFLAGSKNGEGATLWVVVPVKFARQ